MTRTPRRLAGIGAEDIPDSAAFDAYVGPSREVTVDPGRGIVALHDGATAGGKRFFVDAAVVTPQYFGAVGAVGAVGDGTTDDTAAWNAFQAAPGLKVVPPGQYLVDGVVKRFDSGVLGNGEFSDVDYAWPQQSGDTERDSILVNSRRIDKGTDSIYSGPTIKTQTIVNLEVDRDTAFSEFKKTFGSHHELVLKGHYDYQDDGNHNYSCSSFATRNNMAGMMGSTAAVFYSYDAKENENPLIETMGATKTGTAYMQTTRRARYVNGGYSLGLEIYSLNQSDDVDTDIPYANNDSGSFTAFDASVKLTAGGAGSPITHAIMITGLRSKHGYYNGINIGGTAFRINNDTQGPAGTVGLNFATWRTATGFADNAIRYRTANRHHYYMEPAKIRTSQYRLIYEAGSAGISIEAGSGKSDYAYMWFRKGATSAVDGGQSAGTQLGQIDVTASGFNLQSTAGVIRLTPNDTRNGVGYDANTVRFAPFISSDGIPHLGGPNRRFNTVYAVSATINTSDEREKTQLQAIPDEALDAWGEVQYGQYKMLDAVAMKGDSARLHTGVIAQRVLEAFAAHGLNAADYGLLCYDDWEAHAEQRTVNRVKVKEPVYEQVLFRKAYVDKRSGEIVPTEYVDGPLLEEAVYEEHVTVIPAVEAGSLYGIRYEEAHSMEAAYQRRRADRLEARLDALEARLSAIDAAAF